MALYHSARGSVGYTIVGSPTIVDNVVSGFSASDILSIGTAFPSSYTSFEQVVTFTTPNDLSQSFAIERLLMPGSRGGIDLTYSNSKLYLHAYFRTTEATGTDKAITVYTPVLSANTTYTGKFLWNGTTYTLELWQNGSKIGSNTSDNSNPLYIPSNTFFSIGGTQGANDRYFHGSINLNNTYITVNGQPWFGICPVEVKKHQLMGPVGYTVVGTPTITDGVASGFSSSNYLQISQTYNATNDKNVEIYVRAKTPTTISSSFNPIFGADNIGYWGISSYTNALFTIRMGYSNGTTLTFGDMYISGGVQADTWYRFKIKGSNGIWRAEIYNDSGTLLNSSDRDWTSNTLNANYTIKLKCTDNTNTYSGSIDLNETYIKVNGKLWYWQPRETERIVVNGVEVWTKPQES